MTLDEFLEKYTPEYRDMLFDIVYVKSCILNQDSYIRSLQEKLFPKSIEEFFKEVCDEQKAECMRQVSCKYMNSMNVYKDPPSLDMLEQAIDEAPLPTHLLAT